MFDRLGLKLFIKSSGSKGLQVYVPLNTPVTYEETSPFAKAVAQTLEQAHPELVVSDMKKALRPRQGAGGLEPELGDENDGHGLFTARRRKSPLSPCRWSGAKSRNA